MSDSHDTTFEREAERKAKRAASKKVWVDAHKEERAAYLKAWNEANKEKRAAQSKARYEAKKEEIGAKAKARYYSNHEAQIAKGKNYHRVNRELILARGKARYQANRARESARKRLRYVELKYGITRETVDAMVEAQGNRCPCCKTPFGLLKANLPRIDHCHSTGRVRGILCDQCNTLLGRANDNPKLLRSLAEYLERSQADARTTA